MLVLENRLLLTSAEKEFVEKVQDVLDDRKTRLQGWKFVRSQGRLGAGTRLKSHFRNGVWDVSMSQ